MGFVLIVEPEEVNAARIHAILESVDTDFEYELVDSAVKAIDVLERQKPDVFIGDMQMPVMSGAELFSMVEMMSPETIRIVMTDGGKINETIAFMNECRTFKIIIKPCRVADDLFHPIQAALVYKKQLERMAQESETNDKNRSLALQEYKQVELAWKNKVNRYQRVQNIYVEMMSANLNVETMEPKIQERVSRWYQWMIEEYVHLVLCGTGDYDRIARSLMASCQDPRHGCVFQMKKRPELEIAPERVNEIAYILRLVTGVSKDLLNTYQIGVLIEDSENAYVMRIRYLLEKDENGVVTQRTFRIRNQELRAALEKATKLGIDAFGYKSVVLHKANEDMFNIAIPHWK